jgi:hypothetical protein
MGILMGVKWLRAVMVFVFIGVFALATNHCRLEILNGFEFLVCCSHDGQTEAATPHQDDDCDTDGCAALEQGLYKSEDGRIPQIVPLIISPEIVAADDQRLTEPAPLAQFSTFADPGLPASWQFLFRAASPPRAPSIAS